MGLSNISSIEKDEYYAKARAAKAQKEELNKVKSEVNEIKDEIKELKNLIQILIDKNI
jgi:cell division protein FtsB